MATPLEVGHAPAARSGQNRSPASTFEPEAAEMQATDARAHELDATYPDVERYTLSMLVVTFLLLLAGAAMYQSAALSPHDGIDAYFLAGMLAMAVAGITHAVVHARIKTRLLALGRERGLDEAQARRAAREALENLRGVSAQRERRADMRS